MERQDNNKIQRSLPQWLLSPSVIEADVDNMKKPISELDFLEPFTKTNLERCGIEYLFPVQTEVIPWLLQSSAKRFLMKPADLCVSAPTGSGKTLAFVIPIVQSLKNRVVCSVRALVVLPVGELAVQVFKVFKDFCQGTDMQVKLVIGQKLFSVEQSSLVKKTSRGYMSLADIVIATPGRLTDHINHTEGFTLSELRFLVIDEADRMMDEIQQGWLKSVEDAVFSNQSAQQSPCHCFGEECTIGQRFAKGTVSACTFNNISEPLQKLLYSATLTQDPEKLHALSLYRPKLFTSRSKSLSSEKNMIGNYTVPRGLTEQYVVCDASVKPLVIYKIIRKNKFKKVLCFTRSLEHAHRLHLVLAEMLKCDVRELSSSLHALQRKIVLEQFSNGKIRVLICSDIMARGIDIEYIDCVVSYDMPVTIKAYIHRVGRTARAGRLGMAITLLEDTDKRKFKNMLVASGKTMPLEMNIDIDKLVTKKGEVFQLALEQASKAVAVENHKNKRTKRKVSKGLKRSKTINSTA